MAKITVVGIGSLHEGKYKVRLGDTLKLVKEPHNTKDPDAIAVYLEDEQVGYVANSPSTILDNCKSATELQALFEDTGKAVVTEITKVTFNNSYNGSSRESRAFICQFVKQAEEVVQMEKISFRLTGTIKDNPGKMVVAGLIQKGEKPIVKLVPEGDKIVAYHESKRCGHIDAKAKLTPYEQIKALITKEKIAKITSQVGTALIGELEVTSIEEVKTIASKSLEEAIKRVLDEGLATQEEIDERIEYGRKCGLTNKQLRTIFNSYTSYPEEIAQRIPKKPRVLYVDSSGIVKKAVAYINAGRNLNFEGDRGVGKNVLAETLAWLYKRPLLEMSLNSGQDNNSLLGGRTFDDEEEDTREEKLGFFKNLNKFFKKFSFKNLFSSEMKEDDAVLFVSIIKRIASWFSGVKKIKYKPEIIVQAAEHGAFLVMDEFNTLYGHILSVFNSLFDDRRRIYVPGYGHVEAHNNFIVIATQNKDYTSTFTPNEATLDRFVPIVFPALTSIKDILLANVDDIPYEVLNKCDMLYKGIKKCVVEGKIDSKAISIRGYIDACLGYKEDLPLKDALIDNIANRAQDADDRKAIYDYINDMFY